MSQTVRHPLNVLVIDDEPDVRDLLVEYFRECGHEVSSAADGTEAVAEITRHPTKYGIIISDLQLPGVDGLGVLARREGRRPRRRRSSSSPATPRSIPPSARFGSAPTTT